MAYPAPVAGLVLRYSYLWHAEYRRGQEEGIKDRPCAVILVVTGEAGDKLVTVLPITHTPPSDPADAVEIPAATKARLGLDMERSWVMLTEANRFLWPGPDLRLNPSAEPGSVAYGLLPRALFKEISRQFVKAIGQRSARVIPRTE